MIAVTGCLLLFVTVVWPVLLRLAMTAIQQLPNEEVMRAQSKALFSRQEEELLSTVTVVSSINYQFVKTVD